MLVLRLNYGDNSIAVLQYIKQQIAQGKLDTALPIYSVYVKTSWEAKGWLDRVKQVEEYTKKIGFIPVSLIAKNPFPDLVREKNSFPTTKFQWCSGILKGLPFLDWLDTIDTKCQATIVLPKQEALTRGRVIPEYIAECEYHGERRIWHPLAKLSIAARDKLVKEAGFNLLGHRSLECQPCVNSNNFDLNNLALADINKVKVLEQELKQSMFAFSQGIEHKIKILPTDGKPKQEKTYMDAFYQGCGERFGCGM